MIVIAFLALMVLLPGQDRPIATMEITPYGPSPAIGVKIYYGDGKIVRIPADKFPRDWQRAPSDDVQIVKVYFERTYQVWEAAKEIKRHYALELHGGDLYWWSPTAGFGTGNLPSEVPRDATVKRSKWMHPDTAFLDLYNKAHNDHDF